jgi:hypothetical protein
LLACRYTRNLRYEVSEDEHLQLLSDEGILYHKVPKKCKKCNKTNDVSSNTLSTVKTHGECNEESSFQRAHSHHIQHLSTS